MHVQLHCQKIFLDKFWNFLVPPKIFCNNHNLVHFVGFSQRAVCRFWMEKPVFVLEPIFSWDFFETGEIFRFLTVFFKTNMQIYFLFYIDIANSMQLWRICAFRSKKQNDSSPIRSNFRSFFLKITKIFKNLKTTFLALWKNIFWKKLITFEPLKIS